MCVCLGLCMDMCVCVSLYCSLCIFINFFITEGFDLRGPGPLPADIMNMLSVPACGTPAAALIHTRTAGGESVSLHASQSLKKGYPQSTRW